MLRNETTIIDQLYLELAQFTKAMPPGEKILFDAILKIGRECGSSSMPAYRDLADYIDQVLMDYSNRFVAVAGEVS